MNHSAFGRNQEDISIGGLYISQEWLENGQKVFFGFHFVEILLCFLSSKQYSGIYIVK